MHYQAMCVLCSNCHTEFEAPYWQLGLKSTCPSCHCFITLNNEVVRSLGNYRWDVSYLDFVQLVTYPAYQEKILPLLHDWLGYETVQTTTGPQFRDAKGVYYDCEQVHAQIQQNARWQYDLYQAAYPLWH